MSAQRTVKRTCALAVGLLFMASGLSAQRGAMPGGGQDAMPGMMGGGMGMGGMMRMMAQGMMGGGMMGPEMMEMMGQGMGMMPTGGPSPAMILRMGDALSLTAEQRSRLEAIQTQYSESVQPLMAGAMEVHRSAAAALEGDSPDLAAYERSLREAADRMIAAHVAMARAAVEARNVLTAEQRGGLAGGMQMMQGMMGQGRGGMMP